MGRWAMGDGRWAMGDGQIYHGQPGEKGFIVHVWEAAFAGRRRRQGEKINLRDRTNPSNLAAT